MDLMNEKMGSEFGENIFKRHIYGKIRNIFKKNLKTFKSRFICWNPIRDDIIIPIIPGSQVKLHDINDFCYQRVSK